MPPMPRTNRNSSADDGAPPAPSVDAAALDNLDLDDMFADDNDMLFEELDIDLDGMGDIATMNKNSAPAVPPPSAPIAPKRKGGPKTKRPPPPEEPATTKTKKKKNNDLGTPPEILPKRRKTKRKTKSPTFWDDGDYTEEPKTKKKRGSTASAATSASTTSAATATTKSGATKKGTAATSKTKKKKGAASAGDDTSKTSATSPKKSKVKGGPASPSGTASSIPPPLARGSSVAAAGQFGGRIKRGVAAGLPLHKGGTSKSKRKSSTTAPTGTTPPPNKIRRGDSTSTQSPSAIQAKTEGGTGSSTSGTAPVNAPILPPKPEPAYCGIKPSRTLFYPFMEALPAEAALKNRKVYPLMDRISSKFGSNLNTSNPSQPGAVGGNTSTAAPTKSSAVKNEKGEPPVPDSHPIYKLILETYELNEKDKAAFGPEKRVALGHAIGQIRSVIAKSDKPKLVTDLYRICGLLKRQYTFLKQNLQNMEHWCKDNFSPSDYQATYGPPISATPPAATGTASSGAGGRTSITGVPTNIMMKKSVLTGLKSRNLKIKVKCSGFKDPKTTLVAKLPPSIAISPSSTSSSKASKTKESTAKARKESAASAKLSASVVAASAAASSSAQPTKEKESRVVRRPPTYANARPEIRRQRLSDQILAWATHLETKNSQMADFRSRQIGKRAHEVRKLVHVDNDDPELLPPLHTQLMWKALDTAGYLGSPATHWGLPSSANSMISAASAGSSTSALSGAASSKISTGVNTSSLIATNPSVNASSSSSGGTTAATGSMRKRNINDRVFEDWLNVAWNPEMNSRWQLQTTPPKIKGVSTSQLSVNEISVDKKPVEGVSTTGKSSTTQQDMEVDEDKDKLKDDLAAPSPAIADSLFNRLQSLLVEEEDSDLGDDDDDDEEEDGSSDTEDETGDEGESDAEEMLVQYLENDDDTHQEEDAGLDADDNALAIPRSTKDISVDPDDNDLTVARSTGFNVRIKKNGIRVADLSKLSVEERAYLHLCSVGLVPKSLFPRTKFDGVDVSSHKKKGIKVEEADVKPVGTTGVTQSTGKEADGRKDSTRATANPIPAESNDVQGNDNGSKKDTSNPAPTATESTAKTNKVDPKGSENPTSTDVETTTDKDNKSDKTPKPDNPDSQVAPLDVESSKTKEEDSSTNANSTDGPDKDDKASEKTGPPDTASSSVQSVPAKEATETADANGPSVDSAPTTVADSKDKSEITEADGQTADIGPATAADSTEDPETNETESATGEAATTAPTGATKSSDAGDSTPENSNESPSPVKKETDVSTEVVKKESAVSEESAQVVAEEVKDIDTPDANGEKDDENEDSEDTKADADKDVSMPDTNGEKDDEDENAEDTKADADKDVSMPDANGEKDDEKENAETKADADKDVSMPDANVTEERAKAKETDEDAKLEDMKDLSMLNEDGDEDKAKDTEESAGDVQTGEVGTAEDMSVDNEEAEVEREESPSDPLALTLDDEYEPVIEDEMSYVIYAMGAELAKLSKTNNARVSFLQTSARVLAVQSQSEKFQQDEHSSLVSKCQALLKKSKEHKAKSARLKQQQSQGSSGASNSKTKEDLNLPW